MNIIKLSNDKEVIVDDEWLGILSKWKWHYLAPGYAGHLHYKGKTSELVLMHRFIMMAPSWFHVDHINGDGLDNRLENLRFASRSQNGANQRISSNNISGYKGVSFRNDRKRWQAIITVNQKSIHLGYYQTSIEAARAYNEAAISHFGQFALINDLTNVPEAS